MFFSLKTKKTKRTFQTKKTLEWGINERFKTNIEVTAYSFWLIARILLSKTFVDNNKFLSFLYNLNLFNQNNAGKTTSRCL